MSAPTRSQRLVVTFVALYSVFTDTIAGLAQRDWLLAAVCTAFCAVLVWHGYREWKCGGRP